MNRFEEAPALFEMPETERRLTPSEVCLKEYTEEVETLTRDQLERLRHEELITISDTESRIFILNRLIHEQGGM